MMAALPAHAMTADEAPGVVAAPERIEAWLAVARPGDRFVYASLAFLPIGSAGARRMREAHAAGLVRLHVQRCPLQPGASNYLAVRTDAPGAAARTLPDRRRETLRARVAPIGGSGIDGTGIDGEAAAIDALLPVLARFARAGRPCPTDRQLAERAGLAPDVIPGVLAAMVAARLIHVAAAPRPTLRRVTILSSGACTGLSA